MAGRPALPLLLTTAALPDLGAFSKSRRLQVVGAVVLVLLLISVGVGLGGVKVPERPPPATPFPFLDCAPSCNRVAGTGPRPANEVSIAINPKDDQNIVAAANDYGTPNGDAWVGYYWSKDGGKNWNRSLVPGYRPSSSPYPQPCGGGQLPSQGICGFEGAGDPVLAVDKDGNFYLAGIAFKRSPVTVGRTSAIFVAKSTDGGETFPNVDVLFTATTKATFHDKEWIATDPNTGDVYVSWTIFSALVAGQIAVMHSSNSGQSWGSPIIVSTTTLAELPSVQGSQIEVDNNGTVHVAWIDYHTPYSLRYSQSKDHGASWSTPETLAPVTQISSPQGNTSYRTPTMPDMAIDLTNGTYNGTVYIWWPDEASGDADILQVYSRDGGASWSNVTRVNNDPEGNGKSQFFPAVSVAGNGWVVGEFYDRRGDPDNQNMSVYVAISMDGGLTYDVQFNWTDVESPGENGPNFIGDYLGIASSSWYSIGVWCDWRTLDNGTSTDVYAAKLILANIPPPAPVS
jgi:hypothetical protein